MLTTHTILAVHQHHLPALIQSLSDSSPKLESPVFLCSLTLSCSVIYSNLLGAPQASNLPTSTPPNPSTSRWHHLLLLGENKPPRKSAFLMESRSQPHLFPSCLLRNLPFLTAPSLDYSHFPPSPSFLLVF